MRAIRPSFLTQAAHFPGPRSGKHFDVLFFSQTDPMDIKRRKKNSAQFSFYPFPFFACLFLLSSLPAWSQLYRKRIGGPSSSSSSSSLLLSSESSCFSRESKMVIPFDSMNGGWGQKETGRSGGRTRSRDGWRSGSGSGWRCSCARGSRNRRKEKWQFEEKGDWESERNWLKHKV